MVLDELISSLNFLAFCSSDIEKFNNKI